MSWVQDRRKLLFSMALGILCFLSGILPFVRSVDFDLITSDEYDYVLASPVKYGLTQEVLKSVWTETRGAIWMPLTRLSYALDHEIAKRCFNIQYPHYYEACPPKELARILHAHNVFIHGLNASLLFIFLIMMLKSIRENNTSNTNDLPYSLILSAFVGAVLWAVHPLRAEPVCWVASRKDLFSLFWTLAGLMLWLIAMPKAGRPRWFPYLACMVAMALSVWSKPISVVFPLLVLGIDWLRCPSLSYKAWTERILLLLPFFVISLLGGYMQWVAHLQAKPMHIPHSVTPLFTLLNLGAYCWKTVIPVYLHCPYLYTRALPSWYVSLSWIVSIGVIIVIIILAVKVWHSKRRSSSHEILGLCLLFFVSLMLVLFRPIGWQSHADRFVYLAGIWVSLGVSLWLARQPKTRFFIGVVGCVLVCALFGRLSWRQAAHWQNDTTLFARAEACSNPGKNVAVNKAQMLDAYRRRDLRACLEIAQRQRDAWMEHYVSDMVPMLVVLSYEQRNGAMVRKISEALQEDYLRHVRMNLPKPSDRFADPLNSNGAFPFLAPQGRDGTMGADPEAEEQQNIKRLYEQALDFCKLVLEIQASQDVQQARQRIATELEQKPGSIGLWYLSGLLSKQARDFESMTKAWEFCLRNDPHYAFLEKEMRESCQE